MFRPFFNYLRTFFDKKFARQQEIKKIEEGLLKLTPQEAEESLLSEITDLKDYKPNLKLFSEISSKEGWEKVAKAMLEKFKYTGRDLNHILSQSLGKEGEAQHNHEKTIEIVADEMLHRITAKEITERELQQNLQTIANRAIVTNKVEALKKLFSYDSIFPLLEPLVGKDDIFNLKPEESLIEIYNKISDLVHAKSVREKDVNKYSDLKKRIDSEFIYNSPDKVKFFVFCSMGSWEEAHNLLHQEKVALNSFSKDEVDQIFKNIIKLPHQEDNSNHRNAIFDALLPEVQGDKKSIFEALNLLSEKNSLGHGDIYIFQELVKSFSADSGQQTLTTKNRDALLNVLGCCFDILKEKFDDKVLSFAQGMISNKIVRDKDLLPFLDKSFVYQNPVVVNAIVSRFQQHVTEAIDVRSRDYDIERHYGQFFNKMEDKEIEQLFGFFNNVLRKKNLMEDPLVTSQEESIGMMKHELYLELEFRGVKVDNSEARYETASSSDRKQSRSKLENGDGLKPSPHLSPAKVRVVPQNGDNYRG